MGATASQLQQMATAAIDEERKRLTMERDGLLTEVRELREILRAIEKRADRSPAFLHPTKEFAADILRLVRAALKGEQDATA